MEQKINIAEILKDCPKGIKLYSPLFGTVTFAGIASNGYPIIVLTENNSCTYFRDDGHYLDSKDGECLLFPSKDNRDWSTFKAPRKHKRFDPYEKVLCVHDGIWCADFYSHYYPGDGTDSFDHPCHVLIVQGIFPDCDELIIPYKGNEDKLGKAVDFSK